MPPALIPKWNGTSISVPPIRIGSKAQRLSLDYSQSTECIFMQVGDKVSRDWLLSRLL